MGIIGIMIIIGVSAFIVGQSTGKKTTTDSQAAIYSATSINAETWWPAGNGFCYHKIRSGDISYWILGEISNGRCVDIRPKATMNTLDTLIQQGALQNQKDVK